MSARSVSRRDAAAGGIAMLVLAAAAAGQSKAEELDGDLLALCQEYRQIEDQFRAIDHLNLAPVGSAQYNQWWKASGPLRERREDALFSISQMPARTPEGLQAKARIVLAELEDGADPDFTSYDPQQALGHSLALDILGRAKT